jgi:hypothetical protein
LREGRGWVESRGGRRGGEWVGGKGVVVEAEADY